MRGWLVVKNQLLKAKHGEFPRIFCVTWSPVAKNRLWQPLPPEFLTGAYGKIHASRGGHPRVNGQASTSGD